MSDEPLDPHLDLALVRLDAADSRAVRRLAEEMMPLFASRDLHREALVALGLVRRAVEEAGDPDG